MLKLQNKGNKMVYCYDQQLPEVTATGSPRVKLLCSNLCLQQQLVTSFSPIFCQSEHIQKIFNTTFTNQTRNVKLLSPNVHKNKHHQKATLL